MKRRLVEHLPVKKPEKQKKGFVTTVQTAGQIMVLNVYKDGMLQGRHCINVSTGEYEQQDAGTKKWYRRKYGSLFGLDMTPVGYYSLSEARKKAQFDRPGEEKLVQEVLKGLANIHYNENAFDLIDRVEQQYAYDARKRKELNRRSRLKELMARVPALPEKIRDWIYEMEGAQDYAFYDKCTQKWSCTACGGSYGKSGLRNAAGRIAAHNHDAVCPNCGRHITAKTRTDNMTLITHFLLFQPIDEYMGMARFFDVRICWRGARREVQLSEAVRIALYKLAHKPKFTGRLYYNQYSMGTTWDEGEADFDYKGNPANRRQYDGHLYPEGIMEALDGTAWQNWETVFDMLAAGGQVLNYNRLMMAQNDRKLMQLVEMLYKGCFYRLLRGVPNNTWYGRYGGILNTEGATAEEVFGIDRQKINRIREMDGGEDMVEWMRYAEAENEKIPQEVLAWLAENKITRRDVSFVGKRMRLVQIKNYVVRQQAEGYPGRSAKAVLEQWADYLSMCGRLKKHTDDELIYRPRELKRRHDEAVEEINRQRILAEMERNEELARQEAERMRKRFPGAEEILAEICEKYAYGNAEYIIRVPESLAEIVQDGRALHHCAGSSDRYFDRIVQRETYICFLRRAADPETPYYTIEVEPGGTIRQHRGYLDEEPGIEQIRPFLREWQKVIKARINEQDRHYAKLSEVRRQQNIEELIAKNNRKVLEGLKEDFMEAV